MAITVTDTSLSAVVVADSVTFAHVVASGDSGIFVGVGFTGAVTITSVTWNGSENFTELWNAQNGTNQQASGFLIVNPTVGTFNIVVTWSSAVAAGVAGAISLAGLEASSVANAHRTIYTNTGTATPITVTVTDSQNNDLVVDSALCLNATMGGVGSGQTSQAQDDAIGGGSRSWGLSTEPATGASTIMDWGSTNIWATGATALVPTLGTATRIPVGT